jgi:hypothetical protein
MSIKRFALCGLLGLAWTGAAWAHDPTAAKSDHPDHAQAKKDISHVLLVARADAKAGAKKTTGQGSMVFSWDQGLTAAFPDAAKPHEKGMHGGFNEDPETGIVYTGIPGYGLCSISADLKSWKKLGDDKRLNANIHGIVFFVHKGNKRIAVAQNGAQKVLITDLEGKVLHELTKPKGDEFDFEPANAFYGGKKSNFAATDATYYKGTLYVVTGYSRGDFVLTAQEKDGKWSWAKLAWGGKGRKPGQFNTAHGVYAFRDHIWVANRGAHQVVKFTPDGKFVALTPDIPKGSLVCNLAFLHDHFFFCPLSKVNKKTQSSAPIYAHTGEKLVSTIIPGDLGIPILNNIHQVWPHHVKGKDGSKQLYLLVHGWNKGKFAVLKHESAAAFLDKGDKEALVAIPATR